MKKIVSVWLFAIGTLLSQATTRYVDSSATGSNNGSSWTNAWTSLASVTASPGDTVYISGGPSGSTRTYAVPASPGYWNAPSGSAGNWITYQIGQDSAHDGTAIFSASSHEFVSGPRYVAFSGLVSGESTADVKRTTGRHFKSSGFTGGQFATNLDHVKLEGFDCSDGLSKFCTFSGTVDYEISDCYIFCNDMTLGEAPLLGTGLGGAGFDAIKIHNCYIKFPNSGPGLGADGIEISGDGYSIYNNIMEGYTAAYTSGQHQDGIQDTGGGRYKKIYSNYFIDVSNYAIYLDGYYGGFQDFYIYDNVMVLTDTALIAGTPGGISMGVDGGPNGVGPSPQVWNNVRVFNNMVINYGNANNTVSMGLNNSSGGNTGTWPMTIINCEIANNLMVDSGTAIGNNIPNTTGTTLSGNNLFYTSSQATSLGLFKAYTQRGGYSNDLHINSTSSPQYHTGANKQSVFTFSDKDGVAFDSTPSVGAYELATGGDTTAPTVTITSPTSSPTYSTSTTPLTSLAGTASDNVAVSSVTWSNSAGGSGTATGTTSWSVGSITLTSGTNVITVTATDTSANTSTDILTVTHTPPADTTAPTPSPSTISSSITTGTTTATIVATTATDASSPPVQYAVSIDNGSTWSPWQSSTTFNITGLTAATTYQCKVKARDSASTPNETTPSSATAVTTNSTTSSRANPKTRPLTVGF